MSKRGKANRQRRRQWIDHYNREIAVLDRDARVEVMEARLRAFARTAPDRERGERMLHAGNLFGLHMYLEELRAEPARTNQHQPTPKRPGKAIKKKNQPPRLCACCGKVMLYLPGKVVCKGCVEWAADSIRMNRGPGRHHTG